MATNELIRAALSWLATYAVHSTLFLGAAWGLCALGRPRAPRDRERLWKLALVGGVLSATLQGALGTRAPFGHLEWSDPEPTNARIERPPRAPAGLSAARAEPARGSRRGAAPRLRPAPHSWTPANGGFAVADERNEPRPQGTRRALGPGEPLEVLTAAGRVPPLEPAVRRAPAAAIPAERTGLTARIEGLTGTLRVRWPSWVLAAWTAAGLLGLGGFALSWAALRRHLLGRERLRDGPLVATLERLRRQAGFRRRVRLSVSARIAAPFSTGVLWPEICLPRAVASALTPAQQEALLAHELAHLVRRDPAWFALGFLLERLFFFQPLNRLARRQLSELAEVACDDWAVRWTGARLALASCLTEVAGWVMAERPRASVVAGLAGSRSRLGQRIERLLDDRRSPAGEPPTRWWPTIAAATLAVAVLTVPGVSAEPPRTPTVSPSTPAAAMPAEAIPTPPSEGPTSAARTAAPPVPEHASEQELESELSRLEAELDALRAELEARDLCAHFAAPLAELEARLDEIRQQQARARELFARLAAYEPPADGLEPPAAGPAPTSLPEEPR